MASRKGFALHSASAGQLPWASAQDLQHGSFGLVYSQADFTAIDGRNLEDVYLELTGVA